MYFLGVIPLAFGSFAKRPFYEHLSSSARLSSSEHLFDTGRVGDRVELTESAAVQLAAELDALVAAGGSVDVVHLVPARRVEARSWVDAGTLDVWLRHNGKWFGRVIDDDGRPDTIPGSELRPA